jgi:hypothetical protein
MSAATRLRRLDTAHACRAINRPRANSANDESRWRAHTFADADRISFIGPQRAATDMPRSSPASASTTQRPHPTTPGSQIPIAPPRAIAVSIPARGFVP